MLQIILLNIDVKDMVFPEKIISSEFEKCRFYWYIIRPYLEMLILSMMKIWNSEMSSRFFYQLFLFFFVEFILD